MQNSRKEKEKEKEIIYKQLDTSDVGFIKFRILLKKIKLELIIFSNRKMNRKHYF